MEYFPNNPSGAEYRVITYDPLSSTYYVFPFDKKDEALEFCRKIINATSSLQDSMNGFILNNISDEVHNVISTQLKINNKYYTNYKELVGLSYKSLFIITKRKR